MPHLLIGRPLDYRLAKLNPAFHSLINKEFATMGQEPFIIGPNQRRRIREAVADAHQQCLDFAQRLIRCATVNPPGERYEECARLVGEELKSRDFEVQYLTASDRPEHSESFPRINVFGRREPTSASTDHRVKAIHLNGHFDVVPAGDGWTVDPFGGEIRDSKLYGRGSTDMKAGLAAALFAADALQRTGLQTRRPIEISGTVDEESGGFAGVAYLCETGMISRERTQCVVIPEPFGPSRICLGHRGVYWLRVDACGRIAHGSMPHLGTSALEPMILFLERVRKELSPQLATRMTSVPVTPELSRRASLNANGIFGGQLDAVTQTPCVMDRCSVILDRRFLEEEGFETARTELGELVDEIDRMNPEWNLSMEDLMVVDPVSTNQDAPLVRALKAAAVEVTGACELVASPGTYDHKHVARIAGVSECVAYGPGQLELAHQPDEYCDLNDLRLATEVMALAVAELAC